jgi:hypothetical protein
MRKLLLLIATICQSMFLMAHDSHELKQNARQWHIHGQTQDIEGTFCFSKEGLIYIEDTSHQLHSVPFSSLSETDRQYVKERIARIKIINHEAGDNSLLDQNPFPIGYAVVVSIHLDISLDFIGCFFHFQILAQYQPCDPNSHISLCHFLFSIRPQIFPIASSTYQSRHH